MNTLWPGLEFTYEWSNKTIKFLNVEILITKEGLETNLYVKPTNPQLYLHYTSAHPPHVFKAIIYGQALNIKMICSKEEFVRDNLQNLKEKLENRGYPSEIIREEFNRALLLERADLLKPKVYPHGGALTPIGTGRLKFRPTFILTFHPSGPNLRKWLREAFPILQSDKKLKEIYTTPPSVVYRQPANLRQTLICSTFREMAFRDCSDREEQDTPGSYRHNHPARGRKCETCPRMKEGKTFTSTFTGRTYKMWNNFTCKSSYVVYLITCSRCLVQYVGMTTNTMMERHRGHRREIQERSTPLGRHFARCGIQKLSLQIIAGFKHGEEEAVRIGEAQWISRLGTLESQGGLNSMDERSKL